MRERHGLLEITPAEQLVVNQLMLGKSNPEIAAALNLSIKTVKHHLGNVFKKRGVESREQLIMSEQSVRLGTLPVGRMA
jgi:DNA-binding CsgD family transcriptional regulator